MLLLLYWFFLGFLFLQCFRKYHLHCRLLLLPVSHWLLFGLRFVQFLQVLHQYHRPRIVPFYQNDCCALLFRLIRFRGCSENNCGVLMKCALRFYATLQCLFLLVWLRMLRLVVGTLLQLYIHFLFCVCPSMNLEVPLQVFRLLRVHRVIVLQNNLRICLFCFLRLSLCTFHGAHHTEDCQQQDCIYVLLVSFFPNRL